MGTLTYEFSTRKCFSKTFINKVITEALLWGILLSVLGGQQGVKVDKAPLLVKVKF